MDASDFENPQSKFTDPDFDLYSFMDSVVDKVQQLTGATGAAIELVDGNEMVYRATCGTIKEFLGLRLPLDNSMTGLCVQTKSVLRCDDSETDKRVNLEACRKVHAISLLVVPLFNRDKAIGVLKVVSTQPNAFNDEHVKVMEKGAASVASGITYQMMQDFKNFL